mgnify:CR=1 FL=1|jgi:hypothetical protein
MEKEEKQMSAAAIIYLCLTVVSLFVVMTLHGKETKTNFFASLFGTALVLGVLTWGGFFDSPQDRRRAHKSHISNASVHCVVALPDGAVKPEILCNVK